MATVRKWAITWDGINPDPGTYEAAYSSMNAWLSANPEPYDLVTADEQWHIEIFNGFESGGVDIVTGPLSIYSNDNDGDYVAGQYIRLAAAPGHEYVYPSNSKDAHLNFFNFNSCLRISGSIPWVIENLHVSGLDVRESVIRIVTGVDQPFFVDRCYMEVGADELAIDSSAESEAAGAKVSNTIIRDYTTQNDQLYLFDTENVTYYGAGTPARVARAGNHVNTCIYAPDATDCFVSSTQANCASSDDSADLVINITDAEFQSSDGSDMRLAPTSQLIGAGANLNPKSYNKDIMGNLWPASAAWDIGAHYQAGGAEPVTKPNPLFFGQDF